jgi:hypothetical protein
MKYLALVVVMRRDQLYSYVYWLFVDAEQALVLVLWIDPVANHAALVYLWCKR